ncbi:hypothetical protein QBA38_43070, partial [Streptomyces stelliscabiei]|uniref:hypothetical protein n=1 Tax=Streptomyces stelliscabiei TaxID=146820 RepID=UPI002FF3B77F
TDRFLDIRRDPHSEELLARGGDSEAHSVLQRAGFIAVVPRPRDLPPRPHRPHRGRRVPSRHRRRRPPPGRRVSRRLRRGLRHWLPSGQLPALGSSVAHIAERIREANTTEEAADALTELTAAHDGILAALDEVLTATADFHDGLGQAADPYIARRLRYLADEHLRVIRTDLADTRNTLADRHAPHPGRSTCSGEVPATERERSAVCACPPPPRTLPAPPPPVAAGLRR